ncbi:MAG: hypothetical protein L0177_10935 [Chloroflexi bacterium]|nr:hypothetical protein [Chloroflexota bacterium]
MQAYNYANFPPSTDEEDFASFPNVLKAGQRAPDGALTDAASGAAVRLSDYWKTGALVIEFGSIT